MKWILKRLRSERMGITGTPVYEACNNTIQTLQSRYNELDKQLEKLRKDADRITEKISEIRRVELE